ncbi:8-oxoguanine DNA glycosylase OGG fold protein [Sneathiella glossodoripedis]|uniref:8-oxoguanine DNA glycosylase OGG fold protein n=1 Tax=Sneathiella glossodoripedis TaxID=418853 RepID=UPI0004728F84|nr:hypothetical protein [Sneathiella glossodoripedis]
MTSSFKMLQDCIDDIDGLPEMGTRTPYSYSEYIDAAWFDRINNNQETNNKEDLFRLARDMASEPTKDICLRILAWGGMRATFLGRVFRDAKETKWLELAHKIRSGQYSRKEAYRKFVELRSAKDDPLKGMGPAYFTKLIFFLMPENVDNPRGYIMDQWVASSVNLLFEQNVVLMDKTCKWGPNKQIEVGLTVSGVNDEVNYENFCLKIECIAAKIGKTPEQTERILMSEGGKKPHTWRKYVRDNRKVFDA